MVGAGNKPGARDLSDTELVDAAELVATGLSNFRSGTTIVSTTSGTQRVVLASGADIVHGDDPVDVGDKCIIAGTAAAGTYTVAAVIDDVTFDVVEAIVTTTGGTAAFRFIPGAKNVGVDPTGFLHTVNTNVQDVLKDLDTFVLPAPTVIGQVLYTLNGTSFTVETPLVADGDGGAGWLINDDGILLVVG